MHADAVFMNSYIPVMDCKRDVLKTTYDKERRQQTAKTGRVLQLTAVSDDNLLGGLATVRADGLNSLNDVHTLNNLAEDDVLAIEPSSLHGGDEELRAVGVGTSVGHAIWRMQ